MPGGLGAFIPLVMEGLPWAGVASVSVVATPTAAAARGRPGAASVSVVATPTAAAVPGRAAAAAVAVVVSAVASQFQTHAGAATAAVVVTASAARVATGDRAAAASAAVRVRVRAKGKRPGVTFGDGYLGRYQVGQDVPLQVQCVDNSGAPTAPDGAPLALVCREGAFLRAVQVPAEPDPDAPGRFRGRYTLGDGDAPGRYAVVYLYSTLGLQRGDSDQFEVVPGGDAAGPVLAAYSLSRPGGDYLLAHLASGRVAAGQTPYLDEGI